MNIQMAKKHIKMFSVTIIIKEIKIKAIIKYHDTSNEIAKLKNLTIPSINKYTEHMKFSCGWCKYKIALITLDNFFSSIY